LLLIHDTYDLTGVQFTHKTKAEIKQDLLRAAEITIGRGCPLNILNNRRELLTLCISTSEIVEVSKVVNF